MDDRKRLVVPNTDTLESGISTRQNAQTDSRTLPHGNADSQTDQRIAELLHANKSLRKSERETKTLNMLLAHKVIKRITQYAFISQINQSIVHTRDAETLFRKSCTIACDIGKFKMAWIGIFDSTKKYVDIVEQSGMPEADVVLFTNAPVYDEGPQDLVKITGSYYICNDVNACPDLERWKSFTTRNGIKSLIVLPVRRLGDIIGTFNLYSSEKDFFDQEEIALIAEVSGDIAFALGLFEKEKKQRATEDMSLKMKKGFVLC